MKRSEAQAYLDSGDELLWRRGRGYLGQRARIRGLDYRKATFRRHGDAPGYPDARHHGVLIDVLKDDGTVNPLGQLVVPLGQLLPTTLAAEQALMQRRAEENRVRVTEASAQREADLIEARRLIEVIGHGTARLTGVSYSSPVVIQLTLAEARQLAGVLAEHDATFVPDLSDGEAGHPATG